MPSLHPRAWCAAVLVAAVLAMHSPVLVGGRVYHMDDAADGYYPAHVAIARAYRHFELPTWERGSWAGWPINVDPYYGPFYPPSAIFGVFGGAAGLGWTIALHMIAAGLGMLWLLRRRKLAWGPALFGAVSYGLSSFLVERIRHIIFAEGMAWLPFVLVGVEGWLATRRWRELALVGAAAGLAVLCGALPLVPYFVLVVAAYVAPRWMQSERRGPAALGLAAAAIVGGLVACAQVIPTMAHVPLSPRHLSTDYHFAASYAWPSLKYLVTLIMPDYFGGEDRATWFGAYNHWEMAGYYGGVLTLMLGCVGLLRRRAELWALFGVALLGVVLAFGELTPIHKWFFDHVPLFGTLRAPTRALVMLLFAFAVLGAEGLEYMLQHISPKRAVAAAFGAVALGCAVYAFLQARALFGRLSPSETMETRALLQLFVVLSLAAVVIALAFFGRISKSSAAVALALVSLAELVTVDALHLQPRPGDWAPGTDHFGAVAWLESQHPTDRFIPATQGPFRLHNVGMTYGLEGAGGYDSVSVWRYVNLLHVINYGIPYPHGKLVDDLAAGTIKRFGSPLIDLLNVRWALSPTPPGPEWVERYHLQGKPRAVHEPTWDRMLKVYENPHVMPRAFVVYRAEVERDEQKSARRMATLDPRRFALLDQTPDPPPVSDDRPFTPAQITVSERQRLVIEADAGAPGILVVSETHYPGWSAILDGKPAPLLRADYALRGVALPAGHHIVVMRFSSRPTMWGLLLSGLGLVGLGIMLFRRRVVN